MSESAPRPSLDPDVETLRRWGYAAVDAVADHLAGLSAAPVSNLAPLEELIAELDEPLPREGCDPAEAMRLFRQQIAPRMTLVNHPRFHGFIPAPGSFFSTLGEILACGTNPFVGSWLGSGGLGALELIVLRWIAEAVGYQPTACGCLLSGGSMANLTAMSAARAKFGLETLRDGVIYHSTQAHHSVEKAARPSWKTSLPSEKATKCSSTATSRRWAAPQPRRHRSQRSCLSHESRGPLRSLVFFYHVNILIIH